jgi:hypothetical protein
VEVFSTFAPDNKSWRISVEHAGRPSEMLMPPFWTIRYEKALLEAFEDLGES